MKWIDNTENYHGRGSKLKLDDWELSCLIMDMRNGKNIKGKAVPLTRTEENVLRALEDLEDDYRRKANYYDRRERQERYKEEAQQLAEQLLVVTEERDTLNEKIKEAQIASGLFIKSVREKLGWEKKDD